MNGRGQGVLLYGPPGTGKTLTARAVANREVLSMAPWRVRWQPQMSTGFFDPRRLALLIDSRSIDFVWFLHFSIGVVLKNCKSSPFLANYIIPESLQQNSLPTGIMQLLTPRTMFFSFSKAQMLASFASLVPNWSSATWEKVPAWYESSSSWQGWG